MANIEAHLIDKGTQLRDRFLWVDGDSTVAESDLLDTVSVGHSTIGLFVDEVTESIKQYNRLVTSDKRVTVKESPDDLNTDWVIPEQFATLNVLDFVEHQLWEEICNHPEWTTDGKIQRPVMVRAVRTAKELRLFEDLGLTGVLRALIYIINTLRSNNIVWGVGRGSSVSSYVLFLIGVHDVDSVEYELDITDFLRKDE